MASQTQVGRDAPPFDGEGLVTGASQTQWGLLMSDIAIPQSAVELMIQSHPLYAQCSKVPFGAYISPA